MLRPFESPETFLVAFRRAWPTQGVAVAALAFMVALVASGCASIATARASNVKWVPYSATALAAATADKPALVVVTATWCTACNWMKSTTFADDDVIAAVNGGFVPIALDVDTAPEEAQRFLTQGFPASFVVDAQGQVAKQAIAYRDADAYLSFLQR